MKYSLIFSIASLALMTSCLGDGLYVEGTSIDIYNYTDSSYKKATLYIGEIKGNKFIVTDSIVSNGEIEIFNKENQGDIGFPFWDPDLSNVRDSGALYCYIDDELNLFFHPFYQGKIKDNHFSHTGVIQLHKDSSFNYMHGIAEIQDYEIVK